MHDRLRQPLKTCRPALMARAAMALITGLGTLIPTTAAIASQNGPWVWTLYGDANPVVLAQEIPDTPELRTTLECEPGSGRVRVSIYDRPVIATGPVIYRSGASTGAGEALNQRGRLSTTLPAGHPVFVTFLANGELQLSREDNVETIKVEGSHLSKLRRFAQACAA